MKIAVVIVALLLGFTLGPISAQAPSFSMGGRLGITNSAAFIEDEFAGDSIDDRPGFQFGATVGYELNSILSFQVELSYVDKGWAEQGTGGNRKLTYLELPLLLGISGPWTTSPHLLVGPSLSYELDCSVTGVPGVGSVSCSDPQVEWERKKFLLGTWLGLGLGRRFGSGRLDVQVIGNVSLTDMNRETLPRGYIRLVTVAASVAYQRSLGGW